MGDVVLYGRLLDAHYWPKQMTLGDKLFRLGLVSPQDYRAVEAVVDAMLIAHWPTEGWPLPKGTR